MLRTVAGFGRPNNHREVNQRMAKTDARSPRTERGTIALQDASQDIWDKKYRLKSKDGTPVDASVDGTWQRVARALADVEEKASREHWYGRFLWALRNGAIPAGRIISNAGALGHKPATSTINCTVSGTIQDSMDNILEKVHEAGLTLKAGCGIGYEFSTLRPRGATFPVPVPAPAGRCRSWTSTTRCASPSAPPAPRRADGHLRCQPPGRPRIHPRQARGRALAPVQPEPADHRPVHAGGGTGRRLAAGIPGAREGARRDRPRRPQRGGLARMADPGRLRPARRRAGRLQGLRPGPRPPPVGHDHGLHLRLCGAGLHPHRPGQRTEQQLVVRGDPRHPCGEQPLPPYGSCLLGSASPASSSSHLATRRASTGTVSAKWCGCLPGCSTTWWKSTACRWNSNARKSLASAGMAWASSAWARPDPAQAALRQSRGLRIHRGSGAGNGPGGLGSGPGAGQGEGPGADPGAGLRSHCGNASQASGNGRRWL